MRFYLPFLTLFFFSCAQEPEAVHTFPEEEQVKEDEELDVDQEVLDSVIVDSAYQFSIGNYDFLIEDLDSAERIVSRLDRTWFNDSLEQYALKMDASVSRDSTKLIFQSISKDSSLTLNDDLSDAYSEYIHYYFEGDSESSLFWKNFVSYYEGSMSLLVNKMDLDSTFLIGDEYFNPTQHLLLSANFDLEAGFDFNGFQLLENSNGNLTSMGIHEFDEFGFDSIQWLSNSTFIARKIEIDWENNVSYILSWVKVTVSKK